MILPRPSTLPSSIAARWLLVLGSLLAALGVVCVMAGTMDVSTALMRPADAAAQFLPDESPGPNDAARAGETLGMAGCPRDVALRGGSCSASAATSQPLAATRPNESLESLARPERSGSVAGCWGRDIDRATRSESAHLSDLPLCPDPRHALAAMAASLHPERAPPSRHTDGGAWVAHAAFFPALMRQPLLPRLAKHIAQPVSTPEPSGVRESPLETVGAWR